MCRPHPNEQAGFRMLIRRESYGGALIAFAIRMADTIVTTNADRDAAIDAMRVAAEKRSEGILGNSRRQHYGHAALLVASCVAFAPTSRASKLLKWATDLRHRYSRRHAFRQGLARACESLGVVLPA